MGQLTVKDMKLILSAKNDDLEIFFERIPPICGNIESAYNIKESTYGFFGIEIPCLIIGASREE